MGYQDRTCVGEVGDAQRGLEILGEYTSGGDKAHMCYAFELLEGAPLTAARVSEVFDRVAKAAPDGWACWAYSNHDVQRHVSRWNLDDTATRTLANLIICLRGSVCIYQGEELGLPEAEVAFEDLEDPYGIEFWPEFKGRDGCRTPMVWTNDNTYGGFSETRPWLPVSLEHGALAVAEQEANPDALLHHYRRVIALRRAHAALSRGSHDAVAASGTVVSFTRSAEGEDIFCAFNLSDQDAEVTLPTGAWEQLGAEIGTAAIGG